MIAHLADWFNALTFAQYVGVLLLTILILGGLAWVALLAVAERARVRRLRRDPWCYQDWARPPLADAAPSAGLGPSVPNWGASGRSIPKAAGLSSERQRLSAVIDLTAWRTR